MAKKNADDLYEADKAIRDFTKKHKKNMTEEEHKELRGLLKNRANAMSDVLGVKIHSLFDDDE